MKVDYTPYLGESEDGRIWWRLEDAIKLGAGFIPRADDSQTLVPVLRAPNNRVRANERTLIGVFSDARLNIAKPITFERDGCRYVDAAGFLEWLSQYVCRTQSKIEFSNELVSAVRVALEKADAERAPNTPKEFVSLTLALEDWFDKSLNQLPDTLRLRVENDFFPFGWVGLSSEQRRSFALQWDYKHDPATEQDRQFWWDFFERINELQAQIVKWKSAATPNASDISLKESRLKELQQELDRMQMQQRQARGDYYPERNSLDADKVSTPTTAYVAFPKAMKILTDRLGATPEELAAWIFMGPDTGGIAAYRNANELTSPPRFYFDCFMGEDYLSPLMACWFRQDDIGRFDPAARYITGAALIERWSNQPGLRAEAFIHAKIAESRLLDIHPTFGGTRGTHDDDTSFPPLSAGLFAMNHIEQIEGEDALDTAPVSPNSAAELEIVLPVSNSADSPPVPVGDACAAFRLMQELHASEIAISIVGDTSESGLSGNNMLEITARGVKRRMSLAEFGLVDRRGGSLSQQAAVLVGLAHGEKFYRSEEKNSAIMKRLRAELRDRLGIKADPFTPHNRNAGWRPLFSIVDSRGKSDERAKHEAERKAVSLNQLQDQGHQFVADEDEHAVDEDGMAENWLKENDPKHRT